MRDSFQPLRKVLSIKILFDQISMISFGADKVNKMLKIEDTCFYFLNLFGVAVSLKSVNDKVVKGI